jgi:hypothetical protein
MRAVHIVTRSVYVLAAGFYLLLGIVVLLLGTGLLPAWVHDRIFEIGQHNPFTMHLIQETGTLWVLVGMLFVWFARYYDQSITFHWAVTFYLALDAWVHWSTHMAGSSTNRGPLSMRFRSSCSCLGPTTKDAA